MVTIRIKKEPKTFITPECYKGHISKEEYCCMECLSLKATKFGRCVVAVFFCLRGQGMDTTLKCLPRLSVIQFLMSKVFGVMDLSQFRISLVNVSELRVTNN